MTLNASDIRKENVRNYVLNKFDGNRAAFARAAGVNQNQINLILTQNAEHRRNLGEALARRMEASLGLEDGHFDIVHDLSSSAAYTIYSIPVPHLLSHIFRQEAMVKSSSFYESYLAKLAGGITAKENLGFLSIGTHDMAPEIMMDEIVLIDTGVKAITADGVYVIGRGSDLFLRRVSKLLSGGWLIRSPNPAHEDVRVETLKGINASGRVLMVWRNTVL